VRSLVFARSISWFSDLATGCRRSHRAASARRPGENCLEQAFNSLDAQREACAAFILSQKHEGWTVLPATYDDGGFSGGTMERPALKRLIADIEAGEIDVVVVRRELFRPAGVRSNRDRESKMSMRSERISTRQSSAMSLALSSFGAWPTSSSAICRPP
jgi:hypothetical protein